ncbi:hypothetical protein KBB12_01400 [Candidatus Woesebacteria bacterium]|nr:hypothetical protein [Candidatus Woesebacteria bacterium]
MKKLFLLLLGIFAATSYIFLRVAWEGYKIGPDPDEWGSLLFVAVFGVIYGIAAITALFELIKEILQSI